MTGTEQIPSPRPRRPAVVCDQCRTRKLKCDRKLPCNRCVRAAERRDCTYTKAPRPKDLPPTLVGSPVRQQSFGHHTTDPAPSETSLGASAERDQSPDPVYLQRQSSGDQDRDVFPSWCYHGQGSWQSLLRRMDGFYDYVQRAITSVKGTLQVHNEIVAKIAGASVQAALPLRGADTAYLCSLVPRDEAAVELIKKYEEFWEVKFRIISMPAFWKEYHQLRQNSTSAMLEFPAKLLLVMLLGFQAKQAGGSGTPTEVELLPSHTISIWLQAVESWLFINCQRAKPTLHLVQILCLSCLLTRPQSANTWNSYADTGYLLKLAMAMGLHRDPGGVPQMHTDEMELRRRLWATIMEIEIANSLDRGLMPTFTLETFDTLPPTNNNDQDLVQDSTDMTFGRPSKCWFQITLLQSLPLRLEVCQVLANRKCTLTYQKVLHLDAELNKALLRLHSSSNDMQQMFPAHVREQWRARVALLDLHIRRCLLAIHQPFIIHPKDQKIFHYSRVACLDSASVFLSSQGTLAPEELASSLLMSTHLHAFILMTFLLNHQAWPDPSSSPGSLSYMCVSWIQALLEKSRDACAESIFTCRRGLKEYTIRCFLVAYSLSRKSEAPTPRLMEEASKRYGDVCSMMLQSLRQESSTSISPTFINDHSTSGGVSLEALPSAPTLYESASWYTTDDAVIDEYFKDIDMISGDFLLGVLRESVGLRDDFS